MAKYDAFGREIGEDPLATLRTEELPETQPAEPQPERRAQPRPKPVERRRGRRRRGNLIVWLMIIGIGMPAWILAPEAGDDAPAPAPARAPGSAEAPDARDAPARRGSLLTPRRFAAAIEKLRIARPGRLTSLRAEAARIDVLLNTGNRRRLVVQVSPSLDVRTLATTGGGYGTPTFRYADIRPRAPQRLIRESARGRRVNYLVMMPFGGRPQWFVYFGDGRHATGDARGRLIRAF